MDAYKVQFLQQATIAASEAEHSWPDYAACEAALESGFGVSKLYILGNNPFGMKQHQHPVYGTLSLPTREWSPKLDKFVEIEADWVKYPDLQSAFVDRMNTLRRLASEYIHYKNALMASSGPAFITEVSLTWSTDVPSDKSIGRAQKVLNIHKEWKGE